MSVHDGYVDCPDATVVTLFVERQLQVDRAAEVERHLDACTTCRRLVAELARHADDPTAPRTPADPHRLVVRSTHRYVLGHEIARGGMGRISLAEDTLLHRTVAVKELLVPSAALAARFQRELSLTARLQHPAIVTIHDAGVWAGGEPFYVMRLVSGQRLDQVIARHDTVAARLGLLPYGIAMVDALAYAHSHKIIHRDLKPANVLVGDFGDTVVIDWGLAKDLRDAEPPDRPDPAGSPDSLESEPLAPTSAGGTAAGTIVGTPAYMSPEQARGAAVDERADVYALGAVLYQLLCGVPPHTGRSVEEILAGLASSSVTPLAERARGIPIDLLTIVGKAMAQRCEDRYANAGELAADLKRFQLGQLVGAHRYSRWQLTRRWVRRHWTAVVVAAIATLVLAGGAFMGVRRVIAEQHRAEKNRADAEELMTFMLTELRDKLEPIGKLDLLGDVARKARDYYDQRPEERTPDAQYKQVLARSNLAHVLQDQGDIAGALAEYHAARALLDTLASYDPAEPNWQHERSANHRRIGELLEFQGDLTGAIAEYRIALLTEQTRVGKAAANTTSQSDLLQSRLDLGRVLQAQGNTPAALVEYRAALAIGEMLRASEPTDPVRPRELYMCHSYIAAALASQESPVAALAEHRAAEQLARGRTDQHPTDGEALRDLWSSRIAIGRMLVEQGDPRAGLDALNEAAATAEQLVLRDPSNTVWQNDLSSSRNEVGNVLLAQGDAAGALVAFRAGQEIAKRVAAQAPAKVMYQQSVAVSASRVGTVLEAQGDVAGALVQYRAALTVSEQLAARDPTSVTMQTELAMSHNDIGSALLSKGDPQAALGEFRAARTITEQLVAHGASDATLQRLLYALTSNIGNILVTTDAPAALAELRKAATIARTLADHQPESAEARGDLCSSRINFGTTLEATGAVDDALSEYRAAVAIADKLVADDPATLPWQDALSSSHAKIGMVLRRKGAEPAGLAELQTALTIAAKVSRQDPTSVERTKAVVELRHAISSRSHH